MARALLNMMETVQAFGLGMCFNMSSFKLAKTVMILVALGGIGCAGSGGPGFVDNIGNNPGDDDLVRVRPAALCAEGRAVAGIDSSGQMICVDQNLTGMAAKTSLIGEASCGANEKLNWLEVPLKAGGSMEIPVCDRLAPAKVDDVILGEVPLESFQCPSSTVLVGLNSEGEAVCGSLVGVEMADSALVNWTGRECALGLSPGFLSNSEYSIPVCKHDRSAPTHLVVRGASMDKFPGQKGKICPPGKAVIGFGEDHQLICGKRPNGLSQRPSRYYTFKFFGHAEAPTCRNGYEAVPAYVAYEPVTGFKRKLWTCVAESEDQD